MENTKGKKRSDNLSIILLSYYLASIPLAFLISGLAFPYLDLLSYLLFVFLSILFLGLTFRIQKFDNISRLVMIAITLFLLAGSIIFPFLIPSESNPVLSLLGIKRESIGFETYIFYVFAVDGFFLIYGLYMVYVLGLDKNTVKLFIK